MSEIFLACLEKCLVPTLSPGEIVSMESLPAHKVAGVREMIEAAGATMWLLPPYPPDLVRFPLSGIASEQSSKAFPQKCAETTSRTPDMGQTKRHPL
jgi:hypothetical protein